MPAHKRPDAHVVVVIWQVEQVDGVIGPPIGIADRHHRVKVGDRCGIVHPDAPEEAKGLPRLLHIGDIVQKGQHIPQRIAAPAKPKRGNLGDEVTGVTQRELLCRKRDGLINVQLGRLPEVGQDLLLDGACPTELMPPGVIIP